MRQDYTHITMVVDRSGSMRSIRNDAEGGVNQFIQDQAQADGDCTISIYEFDDQCDTVCRFKGLSDPPTYHLQPRGMTAMYDAIGRAITETGETLAQMPEAGRPGLVILVIVTDGLENSSREYTAEQVKEMISHQEEQYAWKFTFLAANIDAFAAGSSVGVNTQSTLQYSATNISCAYSAAGSAVSRLRGSVARGASASSAVLSFTDDERDQAGG